MRKLLTIQAAIETYRIQNGKLPCPSLRTLAQNAAEAGAEAVTLTTDGNGNQQTLCLAAGSPSLGTIPTQALGLTTDFMLDGWGNRFSYHVSSLICSNSTVGCSIKDYRLASLGDLTIQQWDSSTHTNTVLTTSAAYVVLSHGADGLGSFLPSGNQSSLPNGVLNSSYPDQSVNVKSTTTPPSTMNNYVKASYFPSIGNYQGFDDLLLYGTKNQLDNITLDYITSPVTTANCTSVNNLMASISIQEALDMGQLITFFPQNTASGAILTPDQSILSILWTLQQACVAACTTSVVGCTPITPTCPVNVPC